MQNDKQMKSTVKLLSTLMNIPVVGYTYVP